MQFCDECGSMMVAQDGAMICKGCGATADRDEARAAEFVSTEEQSEDDVIEADMEEDFEGKPTATDVTCEKCGHGEAWYEIRQTASADEPPTRFFRCKECGYTWRGYN